METCKCLKSEFMPQCIFPIPSCCGTPYFQFSLLNLSWFFPSVCLISILSSPWLYLEKSCPSSSPRFSEYFSNHFIPQWFLSSQSLQHVLWPQSFSIFHVLILLQLTLYVPYLPTWRNGPTLSSWPLPQHLVSMCWLSDDGHFPHFKLPHHPYSWILWSREWMQSFIKWKARVLCYKTKGRNWYNT